MYSATSTCNIEIINNPSIRRGGVSLSDGCSENPHLRLHQTSPIEACGAGLLSLCHCAGWRTTHPHGCWDVRGVRGGAPLSLLIHGLACLAILVGRPCSAYAMHTTIEGVEQLSEQLLVISCQYQTCLL